MNRIFAARRVVVIPWRGFRCFTLSRVYSYALERNVKL